MHFLHILILTGSSSNGIGAIVFNMDEVGHSKVYNLEEKERVWGVT